MANYQDRIGMKNIAKNGLEMTIVAYRKACDIDVQFEDGYIHEHATFRNFNLGWVSHPKYKNYNYTVRTGPDMKRRTQNAQRYIGQTKRMRNGLNCTIIAYRTSKDIDVQFEDGLILHHKFLNNFRKGNIKHPEFQINPLVETSIEQKALYAQQRIGETAVMNCGQECTIIDYQDVAHIRVKFTQSGAEKDSSYNCFLLCSIQDPTTPNTTTYKAQQLGQTRIGEVYYSKAGLRMTIVAYRKSNDLDVQFDDGEIVEHVKYTTVQSGYIKHPHDRGRGFKDRTGETHIALNGLKTTIENYRQYNDIDIRFENGMLATHKSYGHFVRGIVGLPKYINNIHIKELAYIHNNEWFYICEHSDWNEDKVLSVKEIYNHKEQSNEQNQRQNR